MSKLTHLIADRSGWRLAAAEGAIHPAVLNHPVEQKEEDRAFVDRPEAQALDNSMRDMRSMAPDRQREASELFGYITTLRQEHVAVSAMIRTLRGFDERLHAGVRVYVGSHSVANVAGPVAMLIQFEQMAEVVSACVKTG